jgi:ferrous iron transport protein A
MTLSTLAVGKQALIKQINATNRQKIRLLGLGIGLDSRIMIVKNRSGNLVLSVGGARISMGQTLSKLIKVECGQ